jgi:hypothetical protein
VNRTVYRACSQTGPPDVRPAWPWRYSAAVRPVLVSLGADQASGRGQRRPVKVWAAASTLAWVSMASLNSRGLHARGLQSSNGRNCGSP